MTSAATRDSDDHDHARDHDRDHAHARTRNRARDADYDVLVLGGVGVDTIVRVPELTIPDGDLLTVPPVRDYVAHSGNGVALGFHALGLRTKLADLLGDDPLGDLVRARYAEAGLDFTALSA
jgi:hypothetical protein